MAERIDISQLNRKKSGTESASFLQQEVSLGPFWTSKRKLRFLKGLMVLVNAGLDFRSSLHLVSEDFTKKKEKPMLSEIIAKVDEGSDLASALAIQKGWSTFELENIRIGESSGRLGAVLQELVSYLERSAALRRQLISVLTYPSFLLLVSVGVVSFMLVAVVPLFEDLFKRFGAELPVITKTVMSVSESIQQNTWWILISLCILIGGVFFFSKHPRFQKAYYKLLFRLPVFGPLVHLTYVGRFCTSMAMLLNAKIPLLEGLRMVSEMLNAAPFTEANDKVIAEVNRGSRLSESLSHHKIYPKKVHRYVAIGEEVNKLEEMFVRLSTEYKEEVESKSKLLGKMMEPVIILFVATFIAFILVALYMPLFQFGKLLG